MSASVICSFSLSGYTVSKVSYKQSKSLKLNYCKKRQTTMQCQDYSVSLWNDGLDLARNFESVLPIRVLCFPSNKFLSKFIFTFIAVSGLPWPAQKQSSKPSSSSQRRCTCVHAQNDSFQDSKQARWAPRYALKTLRLLTHRQRLKLPTCSLVLGHF